MLGWHVVQGVMAEVDHVSAIPNARLAGIDLEALYVAEWPKLVRLAYLMTSSESLAEEIAQDAFVRLQETDSIVKNPGGYLRTSVVNRCRDVHRHRKVVERSPKQRVEVSVDETDELFDALATLSWRQHAALVLRYHLDLAEVDIAAALDCRPSTVRSLTRRALANLRKELSS